MINEGILVINDCTLCLCFKSVFNSTEEGTNHTLSLSLLCNKVIFKMTAWAGLAQDALFCYRSWDHSHCRSP